MPNGKEQVPTMGGPSHRLLVRHSQQLQVSGNILETQSVLLGLPRMLEKRLANVRFRFI